MTEIIRDAVVGKEDTVAAIKMLMAKFESGEIACAALRVFKNDGTWDDLAIGGTDEEKAEVLAAMKAAYAQAH